jgi:hypothetical protein
MRISFFFASSLLIASLTFLTGRVAMAADGQISFNRDIRPILSARCYQCHGPDEKHRKANLRLDGEDGITGAFGETKLEDNEAWQRLISTDPEMRMPPPKAKVLVKLQELELLKTWITQGAKYEGHWAFITPIRPAAPKVKNHVWVKNPIDAFILAQLEDRGLTPNDEAARERLLRRVTFDLTGLPPTLPELDAFLADKSSNAYETVVDRLLASRHFGERMTVAWLDAARYGDTSVFHGDGPRDMWGWRDWVINSYNDNKPFDQFSIEQLAGDLIPDATIAQQVATAFNRNNATTDEGGAIAEEFRVEYALDRVKTTSMVWMGLTMECAQCHSHKFDPISQKEYYQFYAYFNQASDPGMQTRKGNQAPVVSAPDFKLLAKKDTLRAQLAECEKQLAARKQNAEADYNAWLAQAREQSTKEPVPPSDMSLHFTLDEGQGNAVVCSVDEKQKGTVRGKSTWTDGKSSKAFLLDRTNFIDLGGAGDFDSTDSFSYGAWIKPDAKLTGVPIGRMDDKRAFRGYDLFVTNKAVAVHLIDQWPTDAVKVNTKATLKPNVWQHVFVTYDGSRKAAGIKIYFDGKSQPWTIEQDRLTGSIRSRTPLYIGRRSTSSQFGGAVDDVRIYPRTLTAAEVAALAGTNPLAGLLAAAKSGDAKRVAALKEHYFANHDKPYQELSKKANTLKAELAAAEKPLTTVMVMKDVASPRMSYILNRGQYDQPLKDQPVEPGVPAALPALPEGAPKNRLTMARWLFDPAHPLTARVAVNRYWYMLFGTGIVKTVEDFGSQGEWPSHPALLDWLAVDFAENGWNIKHSIKQMVMSHTYRQSSRVDAKRLAADRENRLLSRGARFRLQGEFVRDNALAASGLLVPTIGGPSVKPYQPPGLWNEVSINTGLRFKQDTGDKLFRRSMYTYWKRSAPPPSMALFDAPTRDKCQMRRSRTNTPMQALVTLNDVQFVEAARMLAERSIHKGGSTLAEKITHAYRLATGVKPTSRTLKLLEETFEEELKVFQAAPDRAKQLLAIGESKRDEKIDANEHAAMTIVTSMILNLDATLTKG